MLFLTGCYLIFVKYSYDAAEDNELSFREGDGITEIEAVSDDWWSGHDQYGNVGLFPGACFSRAYLWDLGLWT
jgi:Variant SH3 domain